MIDESHPGAAETRPFLMDYLAAHATLQDTLLQSYRQIHLSTQAILFTIAVLLLTPIFDRHYSALMGIILFAECMVGTFINHQMSCIIEARGKDVHWWQKRMIDAEKALPENQRYFTLFKYHQHGGIPVQDEDLIDKGTARMFFETNLPRIIYSGWIIFLVLDVYLIWDQYFNILSLFPRSPGR